MQRADPLWLKRGRLSRRKRIVGERVSSSTWMPWLAT
jgi:hypothetical protein